MSRFRYTIRKAERADVDQLIRLSKLWAVEGCTRGYPAFDKGGDRPEKWFTSGYIWVAELGDTIVGFVAGVAKNGHGQHFNSDGERYLHIHEVYVEPGHRGDGVGSCLVEAILSNAKSDGIQRSLVASGNDDWENTYRFDARHGFQMLSMQMYL